MKIIFVSLCFFAFNYCTAQTPEEAAIRSVMDEQLGAWNSGNMDSFMQTYWKSDSLLFVSSPPTYGWQKTLDRYKKAYPDTAAMGKLSFSLLELRPLSTEYYFVLGTWHLKRTAGDIGGYFTLLFRKINSKWLIVVDHTS